MFSVSFPNSIDCAIANRTLREHTADVNLGKPVSVMANIITWLVSRYPHATDGGSFVKAHPTISNSKRHPSRGDTGNRYDGGAISKIGRMTTDS